MANKKINELITRTPSLTDLMLVGDPSSGYSYKCTVTALADIIETDIGDAFVTISTTQTISGAKTFSNVLTLTSVANSATDTDKFLVLNASNVVNYRTGSEVLSDIGGQGALTLTTTGSSGVATLVGNTLNIPNYGSALSGYVPYTGATTNVDLGTHTLTAKNLVINHASGSGVAASITKGGSGEALTISKTSGSGNAMSVSGGLTSLVDLSLSSISNATTDTDRFLVSDGGVVKYRTGSELLSDIGGASASGYVPYTGATTNVDLGTRSISSSTSTIVGDNSTSFGYLGFKQFSSGSSGGTGLTSIYAVGTTSIGLSYSQGAGLTRTAYLSSSLISNNTAYYYNFPNKGGTFALLDDVTGAISGTTNYIPKFTSSSAIGNSVIYESSSNIGIGTITPSEKLDLQGTMNMNGASGTYLQIQYNGGNRGYLGTANATIASGSTGDLGISAVNNLVFGIGGSLTEQMRLTSTGLGIGTSSPAQKLDVNGKIRVTDDLILAQTNGRIDYDNGVTGALRFYSTSTASERMRITSAGNVGIGTTSPQSILHLETSSGNGSAIRMVSTSTNGRSYAIGSNFVTGNGEFAIYDYTAGATRLWITSGGNVGIGTTSPGSKLSIVGLPTSSSGLSAGDVWNDNGTLKIV